MMVVAAALKDLTLKAARHWVVNLILRKDDEDYDNVNNDDG